MHSRGSGRQGFESPPSASKNPKVARVYSIIHRATGALGGNGHQGPIYGELTQASMQRVVDALKDKCQLGPGSSFIDIGSGLGKPNFHVAQDSGCELSLGMEVELVRWQLSLHNHRSLLRALVDEDEAAAETGFCADKNDVCSRPEASASSSGSSDAPVCSAPARTFFLLGDATNCSSFDPFTHINMFDLGFPPGTLSTLAKVFNRSAAPYLISYQPPRKIIDLYGFKVETVDKLSTALHGSGENHTMYIYQKVLSSGQKPLDGSKRISNVDPLFAEGVKLARNGGLNCGAALRTHVEVAFAEHVYSERSSRSKSASAARAAREAAGIEVHATRRLL